VIIGTESIVCADNVKTVEIHLSEKCRVESVRKGGGILPPIVSADPQIVGHVLNNELAQVVESCFFCFETCFQNLNRLPVIFRGSSTHSDGALFNFNRADVVGGKFLQEVTFETLKVIFCFLQFVILCDQFRSESINGEGIFSVVGRHDLKNGGNSVLSRCMYPTSSGTAADGQNLKKP